MARRSSSMQFSMVTALVASPTTHSAFTSGPRGLRRTLTWQSSETLTTNWTITRCTTSCPHSRLKLTLAMFALTSAVSPALAPGQLTKVVNGTSSGT